VHGVAGFGRDRVHIPIGAVPLAKERHVDLVSAGTASATVAPPAAASRYKDEQELIFSVALQRSSFNKIPFAKSSRSKDLGRFVRLKRGYEASER
jgi:hypothetical protein